MFAWSRERTSYNLLILSMLLSNLQTKKLTVFFVKMREGEEKENEEEGGRRRRPPQHKKT